MYPHKTITKQAILGLDDQRNEQLNQACTRETTRILHLAQEHSIRIEMEEAAQKWTNAYEVFKQGEDTPYMALDTARFEMGVASHRYWLALAQLDLTLDRTRLVTRVQFWIIVVGGLILALVSTVYTVLDYYK